MGRGAAEDSPPPFIANETAPLKIGYDIMAPYKYVYNNNNNNNIYNYYY